MHKFICEQTKKITGICQTEKRFGLILLFIAISGTFFISCQKEEFKNTSAQIELVQTDQQGFTVKDGYLNFKNWKTADSVLNRTKAMTSTERDNWEISISFKSARRSMSLAFAEYEKIQNENEFQKFKQKYISEFIFSSDKQDWGFDYKCGTAIYAQLFSSSGKLVVGDFLYDYSGTEGKIHQLKNGKILKTISLEQNNLLKHITVYPDNVRVQNVATFPFYYNSSNNRRVRSYVDVFAKFDQISIDPSPYYYLTYFYYLHQKGQKTVLGFWNDYNSNLNIKNAKVYVEGEANRVEQTGSIGSSSTKDAFVCLYNIFYGGFYTLPTTMSIPSISYQGTTYSSGVPDNNEIDVLDAAGWGSYGVTWTNIAYSYSVY